MAKRALAALTLAPAALVGCGSSDTDLPTDPPTEIKQVTTGGFQSPTDAVSSPDGKTFYFAAYDMEKNPAIFKVSSEPGSAAGDQGEGVLWAIPADGSTATAVISNLRMGTTGGVSLTAGGGTAVMPTKDVEGNAQLTSVNIKTGETLQLAAPAMTDPSGLRTARGAGVFAVVDSEAGTIYRAE